MRYQFTVREDEEFGGQGLKLNGLDWISPTSGMGAAHDMLEHFPGDNGTMEEEMMALGAMLFVRGETYNGMIGGLYSVAENMASDFRNFNDYFQADNRTGRLRYPGITRKLRDFDHLEDIITEMVCTVRNMFADEEEQIPAWINDADIRGWMRRGYRKARRRYRCLRVPHYELPSLFRGLEQDLDKHLQRAELGDRFTVDIHLRNCSWTVKQVHPEYDD